MPFNEITSQDPPPRADSLRSCGGTRLQDSAGKGSADQPLVTVITAVYNGRQFIAGCLESVLRQSYPNIEHIVMDGASSDGTVEVLRQYDDKVALWRSEPDLGIYDAWNKALREARGEWICFLGADDELLPDAVSQYMQLAAHNPEAEFLSSQVAEIHASGYLRNRGLPWTWKEFSRWMCTPHPGSMHRRHLFDRLGVYDTSYSIVADYELLLRAGRQLRTAYLPVTTVMMREGGVSCTRKALEEQMRAKVAAGGRNKTLAAVELYLAKLKYLLRPLRHFMGGILARS